MKTLGIHGTIHFFALLHAIVTLLCRMTGYEDTLLLTILTMSMAVIICIRLQLKVEFIAATVIVVNVVGYLLGTIGGELIGHVVHDPCVIHSLATLLTTEILGWGILGSTKLFRHELTPRPIGILHYPRLRWVIIIFIVIFCFRLGFGLLFSTRLFSSWDFIEVIRRVFSNSAAIIILTCLNIIYIRYIRSHNKNHTALRKSLLLIAFILLTSGLEMTMVGLGLPFSLNRNFEKESLQLFFISLLVEITIYCLVLMVNYAFTARSEMYAARSKAHLAQFRYLKLKQQINPHFLFNSLNILDFLVCEKKTEQASTFIHKLAELYRYMIRNENETLVYLRDELTFVRLYTDLLKVRFLDGFVVAEEIEEEMLERFVVPCSLQILIENATKHNEFNRDEPLMIRIEARGGRVTVTNTLAPKVTRSASTGVGLNYVRQQYADLSGMEIEIVKTDSEYRVTLPLL